MAFGVAGCDQKSRVMTQHSITPSLQSSVTPIPPQHAGTESTTVANSSTITMEMAVVHHAATGSFGAPVRLLDAHVVNQIAAGEVVERPAAAVKELLENALDSGAAQVAIDLVDSGRTLIRVDDDGSGMASDDALR